MSITATKTAPRWHSALSLGLASVLAGGALALAAPTAQATDTATLTSGTISWGLKSSFRSYLTGAIAGGAITPTAPATDDGTQSTYTNATGSWSDSQSEVSTEGSVAFYGHHGSLNFTIGQPRIVISDSTAQLVVDAVASDATVLDDLALADLDLSEAVTTTATTVTITDAPATLTEAGQALFAYNGNYFYTAGTELDPLDAEFTITAANTAASIQVSKTSISEDETATVTITGSGFEPSQTTATRPPLAGRAGGAYVVVGKFADDWKPSTGATSSARKALASQTKWAVSAEDMDTIGGTAAGAIELTEAGNFTTTMTFSKAELDAISGLTDDHVNYGIYTYPAGGATLAEWELAQPLTFTAAAPAATTTTVKAATTSYGSAPVAAVRVSPSTATGTVSLTGTGKTLTGTLTNGTAKIALPATLTPGTYSLTATYTGSSTHAASTGTTRLTLTKAKPRMTVKVAKKPTSKKKGKVTVTLTGARGAAKPTGKVTLRFKKGKKSYSVTATVKGTKTFTVSKRAKGTWTVSVRYTGNSNYSAIGYVTVTKLKVKK